MMSSDDDTQDPRPAHHDPALTRRQRREIERAQETPEPPPITGAQRALGAALGRPRPRGRRAAALALVAALTILLVPVTISRLAGGEHPSSGSVAEATATAAASEAGTGIPLEDVLEVAGKVGSVPVLSLPAPLAPTTTVLTDTLIAGSGPAVSAGDAVLLSVATFSGQDGANTTGTAAGTRLYRGFLTEDALGPALTQALTGASEGSRLVLRAPAVGEDGAMTTEVTVVDVLPTTASASAATASTAPSAAAGSGSGAAGPDASMPSATLGADGTMTVALDGLAAPASARAAVLIQGAGRQVGADDVVIARYTTVSWADGAVLASTYGDTVLPGTITMSDTMAGIAELLVDVRVGSRVVLALPPDQTNGAEPLAVVIDVLAIADADELVDATSPAPSVATAAATPSGGIVHVVPSATPSASGAAAPTAPAGPSS